MPAFLLPLLLNLAPTVASWVLGDKTGKAVETVTGIIQRTTGIEGDPGSLTPEQQAAVQLALIQAEADHRRLELEEIKEHLHDRQDARSQTVELAKTGSPIAWGAVVVSVLVMVAYGVALWISMKVELPTSQKDNVAGLLWTLNTLAVAVVSYWVGSSAGSFRKDALIGKGPQ
jgi:hypothetical protein